MRHSNSSGIDALGGLLALTILVGLLIPFFMLGGLSAVIGFALLFAVPIGALAWVGRDVADVLLAGDGVTDDTPVIALSARREPGDVSKGE